MDALCGVGGGEGVAAQICWIAGPSHRQIVRTGMSTSFVTYSLQLEGWNCFYATPLISLLIIYVASVCHGSTCPVEHKIAITDIILTQALSLLNRKNHVEVCI
jgi:hypothetical protein